MCKILTLFDNMGISACKICTKKKFLGPGPTLGCTHLIIVDQIHVKLVSAWTYLGKVLLQSILATLDFPLSSYNQLKMLTKSIKVVILTILALHHGYNFQNSR